MAIWVVVCASAFWVYWDATKNKIGKVPDRKGMFNMSAGAWGIVTLMLWIVGLPAYLINRSRLIEVANEHPVEPRARHGVATIFAVIALGSVLGAYNVYSSGLLPDCGSTEVVSLTDRIVRDSPAAALLGGENFKLKSHGEKSYDPSREVRSCRAVLTTAFGEEAIGYTVEWHNKDSGEFWVQIQG